MILGDRTQSVFESVLKSADQLAAEFAEETPLLQALPLEPFRHYGHGERTVHLDACVEVEAALAAWGGTSLRGGQPLHPDNRA